MNLQTRSVKKPALNNKQKFKTYNGPDHKKTYVKNEKSRHVSDVILSHEDINCSICSVVKKDRKNMFECDHHYCDICYSSWTKYDNTNLCPICKNIKGVMHY